MVQSNPKYTIYTRKNSRPCVKCFFRFIASICQNEEVVLYIFTCNECGDTYPILYSEMWGTKTGLEFVRAVEDVADMINESIKDDL